MELILILYKLKKYHFHVKIHYLLSLINTISYFKKINFDFSASLNPTYPAP